ncbi:MAG: cytochrome C [Gammaproteobacteria bacterium]|nr:cytochrome C [Gammaproteobacteria bacterium]MBL4728616.1 cytochrome C [Gammaproteobacteria bacterium]
MTTYPFKLYVAFSTALLMSKVVAAGVPEVATSCQSCHSFETPAAIVEQNLQNRIAPPLYFAGNKFRRGWLIDWLQSPSQIRPSGTFYAMHTSTVDGEDFVDEGSLIPHTAVGSAEAEELADWLMTLTPKAELIAAEANYTPGNVSPRLGAMDFVKFKGCGGCHRDTPEYGGLSGPELYTAWQRLQPGYIVSYMREPAAWDSLSTMPNRAMGDIQIHKLTDYLKTLSGED